MKREYFLVAVLVLFFSCKSKTEIANYTEIQKKGSQTATLAQSVLLANIGKAIQAGGTDYAIEFCNLNASVITDSLNIARNCIISRISAKNRNPENGLKTESEQILWSIFENGTLNDTIIFENHKLIYYKPIKTGLPVCLQCHGEIGSDIGAVTAEKLKNLYPSDLATGYKLNDFRGLWKIEFKLKD